MTNSTRSRNKNQAHKTTNPIPISQFVNNPLLLSQLTNVQLRILNTFIYLFRKYRNVTPNQTTIAKHAGITRIWANKIIGQLEKMGFISSIYRHMTSCIYYLSPWFNHPVIISKLRHLLPALIAPLMLTMMVSALSLKSQVQFTQDNIPFIPIILFKKLKGKTGIIGSHLDYVHSSFMTQKTNGWTIEFQKIRNGEKKVEPFISEAAKNIKSMNLTKWGHIRLSAFPDYIIEWADKIMIKRGKKADPFVYFWKICLELCREHNVTPDWPLTGRLSTYFNMPNDPVFVDNSMTAPVFANNSKKEGKKYVPFVQTDRRFKKACDFDHEYELKILHSPESLLRKETFANFVGKKGAEDYFAKLINEHIDCMNSNH